ncbi:queuosine precursor transporter [Halobacterium bonnevillei]|uniref:Probable queuosine precursor transporter n=1 Tax=Halobacterium bonnevillei TaxID=2692200 RepID=A0A6B0SHQ7_9EURY|nr:queuosine precursor transporter [Halobacterium bonnevillei]MXR21198.1 queuosine precursor transporter [Halobacterium bonnevillei]
MRSEDRVHAGQVALVGLFVTALVTAQLTASKLLMFQIPFELPYTGAALVMPGAALAYALTFFASDCYSELYGRRAAQVLVNVGFAMTLVMLVLVYTTMEAPIAPFSGVGQSEFTGVLWSSANIVTGSLLAYVVSQNWDVLAFHAIRRRTDGAHLWLRNVASTASSQAIDTVIFVTVAFWLAPATFGAGDPYASGEILALIVGQYVLKLAIAVADTPFVYAVRELLGDGDPLGGEPVTE